MRILHVDSSILGEQSVSRKLSAAVLQRLTQLSPDATVVYRDLALDPLPQFSAALLLALTSKDASFNEDVGAVNQALSEIEWADVVVIGTPMYNFSIPSQLKSWLDAIVIPGRTFRYSESGVEGLLGGRRVIIASSRGGYYASATSTGAQEHQESLVTDLLRFVGIKDITVVRAEGVRVGPEQAAAAIEAALNEAASLELAVTA